MSTAGLTVESIKETGRQTNSMDMGFIDGRTGEAMLESIIPKRSTVKGLLRGPTARSIRESGSTGSSMEKESSPTRKVKPNLDCGRVGRESSGLTRASLLKEAVQIANQAGNDHLFPQFVVITS